MQIPSKNIIRWTKQGIERKEGGGRKVKDPKMEKELFIWIVD